MVMAARAFIRDNESRLASGSTVAVNAMRWRMSHFRRVENQDETPYGNPTSAVGRRGVTDAQRSNDSKALQLARNGQACCEDSGLFAFKTQVLIH